MRDEVDCLPGMARFIFFVMQSNEKVQAQPRLPEFCFQSHLGQSRPLTDAEWWKAKGSLVVRGITRSQYEHLHKILTTYFTDAGTPMCLAYMCDPVAKAAFVYLLNHRAHVGNACLRSESKTLHQFGAKVVAWDRGAMAPIEAILARTKA